MRPSKLIFICFAIAPWACGTPSTKAPPTSSGGAGGSSGQAGASGQAGSDTSSGAGGVSGSGPADAGGASGSGGGGIVGAAGGSSGGGEGGSNDGAAGGLPGGADGGAIHVDGGVNKIPAGYGGTPFTQNVIPGFIYAADYDKGGPSVAYCHSATATTATACANGIHLTDWCCSDTNAQMTGARCDDRNQARGPCPLYRPDADNAGLSHMNLGEVDTFAAAGPTWVAGPSGPTLTGPTVTIGTPVPQHANSTTQDDTYLSYTVTGEWQKYTVEVLSAGAVALPASPVTQACKCLEAYHAWNNSMNIGAVTFPAAGTYLMTVTLNAGTYNPLYFTFTKM